MITYVTGVQNKYNYASFNCSFNDKITTYLPYNDLSKVGTCDQTVEEMFT